METASSQANVSQPETGIEEDIPEDRKLDSALPEDTIIESILIDSALPEDTIVGASNKVSEFQEIGSEESSLLASP